MLGGVGTIVLCGAVALRTVRWWRAVCLWCDPFRFYLGFVFSMAVDI